MKKNLVEVDLGDKVEDPVSGFIGIVTAKHIYLNGCTRISVTPKCGPDGKLIEGSTFDAPQLRLIEKAVVKGLLDAKGKTGGPAHQKDRGPLVPKFKV